VGLSRKHQALGWNNTSQADYEASRTAAETALKLDETLAQAHFAMGWILAYHDRNWAAAEKEFSRASALDPTSKGDEIFWIWMGRYDLAKLSIQQGLREIDPLSPQAQGKAGWSYFYVGEYDLAIERAEKAQALDGTRRWFLLTCCYRAKGMKREEAAAKEGFWKAQGNEPIENKPYDVALNHAFRGEKDLAFEWFERVYELPVRSPFFRDPRFAPGSDEPRFEELLGKLNLPEEAIQRHLALN